MPCFVVSVLRTCTGHKGHGSQCPERERREGVGVYLSQCMTDGANRGGAVAAAAVAAAAAAATATSRVVAGSWLGLLTGCVPNS